MHQTLVFDFDSTIVGVETLELLAENVLQDKDEILDKIQSITNQGMEGKITFSDSLAKRIDLFKATKSDIEKCANQIQNTISSSIKKHAEFFAQNSSNIIIISGSFDKLVLPTTGLLSIPDKNVFTNTFKFDEQDNITGLDQSNPLAHDNGKVNQIKKLKLKKPIYAIGDGYSDYQIKESLLADKFFAYTEHVKREQVTKHADYVVQNFDELLNQIKAF